MDISYIKENYARMRDEELILLSKEDGRDLSSEAITALYQEFVKRKLDTSTISAMRIQKIEEHQKGMENAANEEVLKFEAKLFDHAFEGIMNEKTDEEIAAGLIKLGLTDQEAILLLLCLDQRATEIEKHFTSVMLKGLGIGLLGILITAISYSSSVTGSTYIFAWGAIGSGLLVFFSSLKRKDKYANILIMLKERKEKN